MQNLFRHRQASLTVRNHFLETKVLVEKVFQLSCLCLAESFLADNIFWIFICDKQLVSWDHSVCIQFFSRSHKNSSSSWTKSSTRYWFLSNQLLVFTRELKIIVYAFLIGFQRVCWSSHRIWSIILIEGERTKTNSFNISSYFMILET